MWRFSDTGLDVVELFDMGRYLKISTNAVDLTRPIQLGKVTAPLRCDLVIHGRLA